MGKKSTDTTRRGRPQNPPRTDFEKQLRILMAAADIPTYAKLCQKSKVSQATLQEVCSGVYKPSAETLVALAEALNCTVDDLLADPDESKIRKSIKVRIKPSIDKIESWDGEALLMAITYACPAWLNMSPEEIVDLTIEKALGDFQWDCENQAVQRGSKVVELRDVFACSNFAESEARRLLEERGVDFETMLDR